MKKINFVQGSIEWKAHRATAFNASDAPVMMGISTYKSRSELIKERATGITLDVDDATQRRFNDGHRFEALARPLAEEIIGEELSPVTGTNGQYSASFDGITFDESVIFEHKTLNQSMVKQFGDAVEFILPLHEQYRVQMEHQLYVSGAEKCLFMASSWNGDELELEAHCWYESDKELRARIVAGWERFAKDVAEYLPSDEVEKVTGTAVMALPSLSVTIKGEVTNSNLPVFISEADKFLSGIKIELKTDQDFADAESNVKACKAAEDGIEQTKKAITAQATSIDEVMRTMDLYKEKLSTVRLKLDKLVKSEKVARKEAIAVAARNKHGDHLATLEAEIKPIRMPATVPDFAGAMSGLKKLSAMQEAVDTALRDSIYALDTMAKDYRAKLAWCKDHAAGQSALFPDLQQIIAKPFDDFTLLISSRIKESAEREQARLEAQRVAMQAAADKEAQDKAEAILAAERAKAESEQAAIVAEQVKAQLEDQQRVREETEAAQRQYEKSLQGEKDVIHPANEKTPVLSDKIVADANANKFIDSIEAKVEMVTIPKSEYERLLKDSEWLDCLNAAGVDNWSGIDEAEAILKDE